MIWLSLGFGATAHGQAAGSQDARVLFQDGLEAMEQGRFSESRDFYRASLELERNAGTAFNLAVALTRTGEFVEAVDLFGELGEGSYGEISRQQRREVALLGREAEANVASLTVLVPPADQTEIRVSGVLYEETARLDPGEYVISIRSPRHEPFEERLRLQRAEERRFRPTLRLRADVNLGRLIVEGPGEETILSIPGVADGVGRLDLRVEAGTYEVILQSGDDERTTEVEVEARATNRYTMDFDRSGSSTWLWVLGGALAVGAAATLVLLVTTGEKSPRSDPVYGTIETLRGPTF